MYGLVCSGGGAIGAYQVGVLKRIYERFARADGSSPFRAYSGISCGSINAGFAAGCSDSALSGIAQLERAWLGFHVPEYHGNFIRGAGRAVWSSLLKHGWAIGKSSAAWSLFDPKPMQQVLQREISRSSLERCYRGGTTAGLAIAATEITSGFPVWFVDGPAAVAWDRFHSLGMIERITAQHVIASCSIPFFFPPVQIGAHEFLDGGVNLSRPLSGALALGSTHLLCVGTRPPPTHQLPAPRSGQRATLSTVAKLVLSSLGQDQTFAEAAQIATLNRIADQVSALHLSTAQGRKTDGARATASNAVFDQNFRLADYRKVSVLALTPSISPAELFREFIADQRASGRPPHHEFMFHRDFIARLMLLGYQDVEARADELQAFFTELERDEEAPATAAARATS